MTFSHLADAYAKHITVLLIYTFFITFLYMCSMGIEYMNAMLYRLSYRKTS